MQNGTWSSEEEPLWMHVLLSLMNDSNSEEPTSELTEASKVGL